MNRMMQHVGEPQVHVNALLGTAPPHEAPVNMMLASAPDFHTRKPPRLDHREMDDIWRRREFEQKWFGSGIGDIDPMQDIDFMPPEMRQQLTDGLLQMLRDGVPTNEMDARLRVLREQLKQQLPTPWRPW